MQQPKKTIAAIWFEVKLFLDIKMEYYKLRTVEKASRLIADLITNALVVIFMLVAFLSAAVTLAFYLSSLLGNYAAGFGIAALFFLLLAIVVLFAKERFVNKWISNAAIRRYFAKHCNEDE